MKKDEIRVGGLYLAKVSGNVVTVRVDTIRISGPYFAGGGREVTVYDVTNLSTGRKTTFRSAAKFRGPLADKVCAGCKKHVPLQESQNTPFGMHSTCYARSNAAKMDRQRQEMATDAR